LPVRISQSEHLSGLVDEISGPAFATSHGLILYGIKNSKQINGGFSMNKFGKIFKGLPVKGAVSKTIEFIKSFLP
jgi:cell division ATPase FtsA